MFERFTDRARRTLVLAQEEVHLLQQDYIGTEHLLLGLLHEGKGVAANALTQSGVTLDGCRRIIASTSTPSPTANAMSPAFTAGTKKVMEGALGQALRRGHNYIGTEHLLLALLENPDNKAVQVLVELGADPFQISQGVDEILLGYSQSDRAAPPNRGDAENIDLTLASGSGARRRFNPEEGPICYQCRAPLRDFARYRTIQVPPGLLERSPDSLTFKILYCSRCGAVATGSH